MGLIDRIWTRRRRRGVARTFGKYVDPATVRKLLDDPALVREPPTSRAIDFVVALVRDDTLADVPALLGEVDRLTRAHHGCPDVPNGPVVFVTFGAVFPDAEATAHRRALASALADALGDRVKLVHGSGVALVGNVAGDAAAYGVVVRGFAGLLGALTALAFGEAREVNP
jgi:hypothetical protein